MNEFQSKNIIDLHEQLLIILWLKKMIYVIEDN